MTCIKGLFGFVRIVSCYMGKGELLSEQVAMLFFCAVVRLSGLPDEALELELNTAVSDSPGKPPALVALGEMPQLPVDLIVGTN